ncbi:MAG: RNA polymerase sigma factor [Spirochaetota bacterium]
MQNTQTSSYNNENQDLLAVQETLQGNKQAFTAIVERYTPLIYSLSYRMLGNSEEAEDAVQEIFLRVYRSLSKFRLSKRFYPWMYTIALNWLRSCLKKRKKKKESPDLNDPKAVEYIQQKDIGPQEKLEQQEGERLAQEAISMLRPEYRGVFILRHIHGFSTADVAEILHLPEGTVKTYLHRSRKALVESLKNAGWY